MKLLLALAAVCGTTVASPTVNDPYAPIEKRGEVNGSYVPTTAPRENIFSGITPRERQSIFKFLERQVNSTIPADIYFGWYDPWLLAPNKTDATSYLDSDGKKPQRYARVMGEGDCYTREYLVGPLPICSKTKAVPLDWLNGGNATVQFENCRWDDWPGDDEDDVEDGPPHGNSTRLNRPPPNAPPREHSDERPQSPEERPDERKKRHMNKRRLARRGPDNPYDEKMEWNGEEHPHDEKAAPTAILPDGARHGFDPKQNYVSWMDFTFFVATGPGGISIHDVRFKGERVVYEIAMQEALAHYAGPGQWQNDASYLDVAIGFTNFNLIPGYDCPSYATYTEAFCLFEFPKDYPISRHQGWDYYHATKNTAFMLRSVSTVSNYDYQTTYEFHYDGTIQVIVRATGYIQGDDDVESEDANEYGFRIRDHLSGSMHDHVLNFKADLDVKGTKNSLFKTEFVPNSQVYEWSEGNAYNNMKVERSFVNNEADGKINWAANSAAAYAVVNKDEPNEFGEYPGFRIYPSLGSTIHLTVENSTVFPNQVQWASHQLYALQRKDTEPVSIHPQSEYGRVRPRVAFNDFFDGESMEQEDLVLYFNLGMHHMPDTYDLPVTVFQGAQSGIALRPQNYQRSNNAVSTRQQVHVTNFKGVQGVETYGVDELSGSYDLGEANPPYYPMPDDSFWEDDEDWEDGEDEE